MLKQRQCQLNAGHWDHEWTQIFLYRFFIRAWTVLWVCVCVFICVNVERGSFQRRGPFLLAYNEDGNSLLWSFKMHSFFKVITNKTSSKPIKYFVDDYQCEKDKRNTLYSLSRVFNFGTNLYCAPHLQMLVIFLPLHVEKLLSLCIANVVLNFQDCRIFVMLLCSTQLPIVPSEVCFLFQVCQNTTVRSTRIQKQSIRFSWTPLKGSDFTQSFSSAIRQHGLMGH